MVTNEQVLEEIKRVCSDLGAKLRQIKFENLDVEETNTLDVLYNADVAIIDLSVENQQNSTFHHIAIRGHYGMKNSIILFNDVDNRDISELKENCESNPLVTYRVSECGKMCYTTNPPASKEDINTKRSVPIYFLMKHFKSLNSYFKGNNRSKSFTAKLTKLLQNVESQSQIYVKEKFLNDLRKARDMYKGDELRNVLHIMRKKLDDPRLLSGDVLLNILMSFRDIQDYVAMVQLAEDLENYLDTPYLRFLYPFALDRRNNPGDKKKALKVIAKFLEKEENHIPNMLSLCGRIYKNKFVKSKRTDKAALRNAIHWYRKGFKVRKNELAGINLATLLLIDGNDLEKYEELRNVVISLNILIGKKGGFSSLKTYWDFATYFEINVLAENYNNAVKAFECMFKLNPPVWCLKSTMGNISLITTHRKKIRFAGENFFDFCLDYLADAIKTDAKDVIRFPIMVLECAKDYVPSYVVVNLVSVEKVIDIWNVRDERLKEKRGQIHSWSLTSDKIRGVSCCKKDERCLFLYVRENGNVFQMFFPSELYRTRFLNLILEITRDQEGMNIDLVKSSSDKFQYEYVRNGYSDKVVLGTGSFGIVYAARDLNRQVDIVVKEFLFSNSKNIQSIQDEIILHSPLKHPNIVQYLDSRLEQGRFKIFMERLPDGSLSYLLKNRWGPLKNNENLIKYLTKSILEGLKYLHAQKIVHCDIKGDNILVNICTSEVKISDFGISKLLAALLPEIETFAGTVPFMAPEVMRAGYEKITAPEVRDEGDRSFGTPADIWSLGSTIIEMANGHPPFKGKHARTIISQVGSNIHPEIPVELSEEAKRFIRLCFEKKPALRATAASLLEDSFLNIQAKSYRDVFQSWAK